MRISISWRSANRLIACAAPSSAAPVEVRAATVYTLRSLKPAARAAARIASRLPGPAAARRLNGVERRQAALRWPARWSQLVGVQLHGSRAAAPRRAGAGPARRCRTASRGTGTPPPAPCRAPRSRCRSGRATARSRSAGSAPCPPACARETERSAQLQLAHLAGRGERDQPSRARRSSACSTTSALAGARRLVVGLARAAQLLGQRRARRESPSSAMRLEAAARRRARSSKPQPASASRERQEQCAMRSSHQTTRLTSRPGTTMIFFTRGPRRTWRSPGWPARRPRSPPCRPGAARDRAAQLAVDLQHEFDLVLHQRRFVDLRPRRVEQVAVLAAKPSSLHSAQVVCGQAGYSTRSRMPIAFAQRRRDRCRAACASSALSSFIAPETTVLYCMRS